MGNRVMALVTLLANLCGTGTSLSATRQVEPRVSSGGYGASPAVPELQAQVMKTDKLMSACFWVFWPSQHHLCHLSGAHLFFMLL